MNKLKEYINPKSLKINYINNQLNIVNFKEINLITDNKIILLTDNSTICIKGNNLSLLKLLDYEILISGNIKVIEL